MMTRRVSHADAIERLLRRRRVADLVELRRAIAASGRTVFRVLGRLGYLSSYSHAGGYYTLREIPKFDDHGLWFVGEVRFSKYGTLRATLVILVRESPAGRTHEELSEILGLRVHDTLHSLVEAHVLGREQVDAVYVYVDGVAEKAAAQLAARHELGGSPSAASPAPPLPSLDPARVIAALLVVIHKPRASATTIADELREHGLGVTDEQIENLFAQYGLGKKTARSRSQRSQH
jgi:hypothetical protein